MNSKSLKTVDEAVNHIITDMPLDEKVRIARLSREELASLKLTLRAYVHNRLEESGLNEELRESCMAVAGEEFDKDGTSAVIIDALWERLSKTHGLRLVG